MDKFVNWVINARVFWINYCLFAFGVIAYMGALFVQKREWIVVAPFAVVAVIWLVMLWFEIKMYAAAEVDRVINRVRVEFAASEKRKAKQPRRKARV